MTKLELVQQMADQARKKLEEKYNEPFRINIGLATCEIAAGSIEVKDVFEKAIAQGEIKAVIGIKGCAGRCNLEPTVELLEKGKLPVTYCKVTPEGAREIIEQHIKNGEPVQSMIIK